MKKFLSEGQSLWEVIIALAVAGLISLGLVRATTSSIKSSRFSRDQSQMTALAQKKIAGVINKKNTDPSNFWFEIPSQTVDENIDDYCFITTVSIASLPTKTPDYSEARMALVAVDVFWESQATEKNKCGSKYFLHKLHFETYVTN